MAVSALLLGAPGRFPFTGHFRFVRQPSDDLRIAGAGRLGARLSPALAFGPARRVERVLSSVSGSDCNEALRAAWTLMMRLPSEVLGELGGADLSMLLVGEEPSGVSVMATGLGGLFALRGDEMVPVVDDEHPMLGPPGVPEAVPGVLVLDADVEALIGVPAGVDWPAPTRTDYLSRCGVHP